MATKMRQILMGNLEKRKGDRQSPKRQMCNKKHKNIPTAIVANHRPLNILLCSHTIIVQAGSFTGKVITLRLSRLFSQGLKIKFSSVHLILIRSQHPTIYHPLSTTSPSFWELTQLNKQDNTNFNLLGGHVVKFRDVDMAVIVSTYHVRELSFARHFHPYHCHLMSYKTRPIALFALKTICIERKARKENFTRWKSYFIK